MSVFSDALDRVGVVLKSQASETMTYKRGGDSASITVTPQGQRRNEINIGGVLLEEDLRHDFTLDAADLVLATVTTLPQRGDRITWGADNFEVVPIDDQTYTYVTSSKKRLRVHTRKIYVAPASGAVVGTAVVGTDVVA